MKKILITLVLILLGLLGAYFFLGAEITIVSDKYLNCSAIIDSGMNDSDILEEAVFYYSHSIGKGWFNESDIAVGLDYCRENPNDKYYLMEVE